MNNATLDKAVRAVEGQRETARGATPDRLRPAATRRGLRTLLRDMLVSVASRWPRGASLYYAVFSSRFGREHQAVLAGMARYRRDVELPAQSSALLRRNTHRLEKGLLMVPRRRVFAVDYIDETVEAFRLMTQGQGTEQGSGGQETCGELRWARDVLAEYFASTDPDPRTDRARKRFNATASGVLEGSGDRTRLDAGVADERYAPYRRDLDGPPPVAYADLLKLAHRRRSVRWFESRAVPREMIDRAVAVAAQSPTACNRQPFVFRIFDDPAMVARVAKVPMGTAGYVHNIPVIVVVVGQLRDFFDERDRHLIYIDSSLATMAFVLALESQGLSSCCINWPDLEGRERRMSALLKLEPDERPIMCVAVGYPDPQQRVAYSQKKPFSLLREYNFE